MGGYFGRKNEAEPYFAFTFETELVPALTLPSLKSRYGA